MSLSLQLGLGLINGFGGSFSPAALFAAGEQGAWYDPSDLTSMRQLSTGVTAVAAPGDPVGFLADKRLMGGKTFDAFVAGQPELVTNGDFSNGTTGWSGVNGTIAVVGGELQITADGAGQARATQSFTTVIGQWYTASATLRRGTGAVSVDLLIPGIVSSTAVTTTTATTVSVVFIATATSTAVRVGSRGAAVIGDTYYADNVSVKAIPGNHATQSNAAQRPTYGIVPATGRRNLLTFTEQFDNAAWASANTGGTGVVPVVTSNAAVAPDGTTTADRIQFNLGGGTTTSDLSRRRQVTVTGSAVSGTGTFSFWARTTDGVSTTTLMREDSNGFAGGQITVTGTWQRFTITAATYTTGSSVGLGLRGGQTPALPNTADILVWGAQLETGSTATAYQKVVSAFDVTEAGVSDVYYLAFDGVDDSLSTGNIAWGTGNVTVTAGQQKLSDAAAGTVLAIANGSGTVGGFELTAPPAAGPTYRFGSRGDVGNVNVTSGNVFPAPDTGVITGLGSIPGAVCTLRRNAVGIATNTTAQGTIDYTTNPLYIGRRGGTTQPYNGRIFNLVARNALTSGADLTNLEAFVAGKTGLTI